MSVISAKSKSELLPDKKRLVTVAFHTGEGGVVVIAVVVHSSSST